MPYALSLQTFCLPEFFAEAPDSWERRLREISPVHDKMDHLRFRYRAPKDFWNHPERGQWELYACTPKAVVPPDEALAYEQHWSELPTEFQEGRKSTVSSYQHFMWHTQGVRVKRYWVLQGEWGGTAARYTAREKRYLDGSNAISEPYPLGFFPACPFDERAVKAIQARDRLLAACGNFDRLQAMDKPEWQKAEDEAAERIFRETYLDTWYDMMQPQAEFMKSYLRKSEADMTLPPAPEGTANAVAQWRDQFVEHGNMVGAKGAVSKTVSVAVA